MGFSHLDSTHVSKKYFSSNCAGYRHKQCKGDRGHSQQKCECNCHE